MSSPHFVDEIRVQVQHARETLENALATGDADGAATAQDRLRDLADIVRIHGPGLDELPGIAM